MLTKVLVVQPPNWEKPFHVFVDVSDVAIHISLMQLSKPNRYRAVYYASLSVRNEHFGGMSTEEVPLQTKESPTCLEREDQAVIA